MSKPPALINTTYANAAAIQAIPPNDRQDGDPAFDKDTGVNYHFDAEAVAGGLTPDRGTGRWIADATVAGAVAASDLAGTGATVGSYLVGYSDPSGKTATTKVRDALDEIYVDRLSTSRCVPIKLTDWRIVSSGGDVGNIAAAGGVMASNSDPILRGDSNNSFEIFWAANSVVPVGAQLSLPPDLDDTAAAVLELDIYSGSTDAATMGVASSWNGGSEVTDSADDSGTKSASVHTISATIAAADIPATSRRVTLRLTPPSHSTNGIGLVDARLRYTPKLLT